MKLIAFDIETNGLENPTVIWCVVCKDLTTKELWTFDGQSPGQMKELQSLFDLADHVIGHNVIGYDLVWLRKLVGVTVPNEKVIDTLVLSRLYNFPSVDGEGHSLREWGVRLKFPKTEWSDFSAFHSDMVKYCVNDVHVTHALYDHLMRLLHPIDQWKSAIGIEHALAFVCEQMHEDGFPFDVDKAKALYEEVAKVVADLDAKLDTAFPPKSKLVREYTPCTTKIGAISRRSVGSWYKDDDFTCFTEGCSFSLFEWVPFNPASPKQIVERLNEAGWRPFERTKGYLDAQREGDVLKLKKLDKTGWKVNEVNLATLPDTAPEATRLLVRRILLGSRLTTLDSWFESYRSDTGCVHGTFNGLGTWTHRMSHVKPNLGNVSAHKSIKYKTPDLKKLAEDLGGRMRELWTAIPVAYLDDASSRAWLVGTDADGIQLRILAHYMDDKEFTEALVRGSSKNGTDAHSLNRKALGEDVCKSRDVAKTFIYAWLLGAGIPKIADILGCDLKTADEAVKRFINKYPGLKRLKEVIIPADAKRGFFIGLDGRRVPCTSKHLMLAGYLQNGEACIMKHALRIWMDEATKVGLKFTLRNFVHDEFQTTCYGTKEDAEKLGTIQANAIATIGEIFKLRCPLLGNSKQGFNWLDTH